MINPFVNELRLVYIYCRRVHSLLIYLLIASLLCTRLEPTKSPSEVKVMVISTTTASVSWKSIPCSHQNGMVRFHLVRYVHSLLSGEIVEGRVRSASNHPRAKLCNLRPNTNYVVMVAGWNSGGLGPFSSPVTFVTPGGKKQ